MTSELGNYFIHQNKYEGGAARRTASNSKYPSIMSTKFFHLWIWSVVERSISVWDSIDSSYQRRNSFTVNKRSIQLIYKDFWGYIYSIMKWLVSVYYILTVYCQLRVHESTKSFKTTWQPSWKLDILDFPNNQKTGYKNYYRSKICSLSFLIGKYLSL